MVSGPQLWLGLLGVSLGPPLALLGLRFWRHALFALGFLLGAVPGKRQNPSQTDSRARS